MNTLVKKFCKFLSYRKVNNLYLIHLRKYCKCPESKETNINPIKLNAKIEDFPYDRIRNFSIIAHVDHGKSTLADRFLEITGIISSEQNNEQVLDKLQVERERGITVKAQSATLLYHYRNELYMLNLIDTPGHTDFSFEVSRSLSVCDGVILLVDANQGVQAQTVANFYLAFAKNLTIIPVLNKIDLKTSKPNEVALQINNLFEIDITSILKISAKLGIGIQDVVEAVIQRVSPPSCSRLKPLRALLFDSWYDQYKGVVAMVFIKDGYLRVGDRITSSISGKSFEVREVGIMQVKEVRTDEIGAGQIGYFIANIRKPLDAQIGDTFFIKDTVVEPLPYLSYSKCMVFAGVYPFDQSESKAFQKALEKLILNDSSVSVHREHSAALGQGFRLGFLGLLHMEVFNQRLEQEFGMEVIITQPTVTYKAKLNNEKYIKLYGKEELLIQIPADFPNPFHVEQFYEPIVLGTIIVPLEYFGAVLTLCHSKRAIEKKNTSIDANRVLLVFQFPLNEIIVDFYDQLKSVSSGYASFDYEECGYQPTQLLKLDILLNGQKIEELSMVVNALKAHKIAREIVVKLRDTIPRQLIPIAIQSVIEGKVLARENIKALRKDVTAKCYGGDISRKQKLLKQQASGKQRMKKINNVFVPRDIFIKILRQ